MPKQVNATLARTKHQTQLRELFMVESGKLTQMENLQRYLATVIVYQAKKVAVLNYRYRRSMGWKATLSNLDTKDAILKLVENI